MNAVGLEEKDLGPVAGMAFSGDRAGAIEAATKVVVSAATGHPLLGAVAGKGARALATAVVDQATQRFLDEGKRIEDGRERAQRLQRCLLEVLLSHFEALQERDDERFLQLVRCQDRGQAEVVRELRELRRVIVDSMAVSRQLASPIPFEGPGRAPATPVPWFSAQEELDQLKTLLSRESAAVVIVVEGMGGIGKTTLARELVARHGRELFPQGVAWLDADELAVDMPRVCRLFGYQGDREPVVEEARQWLGRELCARQTLLVVDNVSPHRIHLSGLPFPGGHCRTLLTSRDNNLDRKLGRTSSRLPLDQWPLDRCRSYLRDAQEALRKESDSDLDALSKFVGGLPLALQLLAAHPSMRRGLSAKELVGELEATPVQTLDRFVEEGTPGLAGGVVKTFQAAWDALGSTEGTVLRALCVCARGTRTEILAATAQLEPAEVEHALNSIADVSLAQYRKGAVAPWTLHDVVRLFASAQRDSAPFEAAHQRWVEQYMRAHADPTDWAAFEIVVPEGIAVVERLLKHGSTDEADRVYAPLYRHLRRRGEYGPAATLCTALVDKAPPGGELQARWLGNLGGCYIAFGNLPKAMELHQRALSINEQLGRLEGQAIQLGNLGLCHTALGDPSKAIALHQRALAIHEQLGNLEGQANQLGDLGPCYRTLGDLSKAIDLLRRALAINEQLGNLEGQAAGLGNLGLCCRTLGDIPRAMQLHQRALAINEQLGSLEGQAADLGNLGLCYRTLGDLSKAMELHRRALAIHEQLGSPEGQASELSNLGLCYGTLGGLPEAMELHQRALVVYEQVGSLEGQANQFGNLGLCYSSLGDLPKAMELHQRALAIDEHLGSLEGQAVELGNLGLCHRALGDLPKAIDFLQRALAIHEQLGSLEGQAADLGDLGLCHRTLGDLPKAIDSLQRSLAINEKLGSLDGRAIQLGNLGFCYAILGDIPRAQDHLERALALYARMGLLETHPNVQTFRGALEQLS